MSKIISLTDVLENKIVKEKELQYYREQLEEIQRKIAFLETDLNITKQIISMIEQEKIIEVDTSVPVLSFDNSEDDNIGD
jgi:prefoldin subunit 5